MDNENILQICNRTGIDAESLQWILNFVINADEILHPLFRANQKIRLNEKEKAAFEKLHSIAQKLKDTAIVPDE